MLFLTILEISPIVAIVLFLLMVLITFYRNYRAVYRLVYSTEKICLTCKELGDWTKEENVFKTRVIFYNNGRKSLNKKVIPYLHIKSKTKNILSAVALENKKIDLKVSKGKVKVNLNYLDSKEFVVIELEHYKNIDVVGRTDEFGKILNTESKTWLIINILVSVIIMCLMVSSFITFPYFKPHVNGLTIFLSVILASFLLFLFIRYLHSLFFIPDKIVSKYLSQKSKLGNEFSYTVNE